MHAVSRYKGTVRRLVGYAAPHHMAATRYSIPLQASVIDGTQLTWETAFVHKNLALHLNGETAAVRKKIALQI